MSLSGRLFAAMYDRMVEGTEKAGLGAHRQRLLATAAGRVIEIGAGTGANLPYYPETVCELVACEPEEPMARRLERKLGTFPPTRVLRAAAERLPVDSGTFDVAICTLVLCTVADVSRALGEIQRVLKPGGRLLFIEHVRSSNPGTAKWQDRLNFLNRAVAHGCNCNRDTLASLAAAGFTISILEHHELPKAPPFVRPLIVGTAVPH